MWHVYGRCRGCTKPVKRYCFSFPLISAHAHPHFHVHSRKHTPTHACAHAAMFLHHRNKKTVDGWGHYGQCECTDMLLRTVYVHKWGREWVAVVIHLFFAPSSTELFIEHNSHIYGNGKVTWYLSHRMTLNPHSHMSVSCCMSRKLRWRRLSPAVTLYRQQWLHNQHQSW